MAEGDQRYRLAAHVVPVGDKGDRRAVLYAVGNTVVCDSLDVTREICFERGGREQADGSVKMERAEARGAVVP